MSERTLPPVTTNRPRLVNGPMVVDNRGGVPRVNLHRCRKGLTGAPHLA